jgi:protein associated with RNAse G/E
VATLIVGLVNLGSINDELLCIEKDDKPVVASKVTNQPMINVFSTHNNFNVDQVPDDNDNI